MCVNFTPIRAPDVVRLTGAQAPLGAYPATAFPGYVAPIVRQAEAPGEGLRVDLAAFGLIPAWSKDRAISKRTYNARSETVHEKPSYRSAWRMRRFCLVPMEAFFEPCWETGRAVKWSIHRCDREPFAVAAIWDQWTDRGTGEIVESFSMLTINADGHPVMGRFHRPGDERRSLVIVPPESWPAWLSATTDKAVAMLQPIDAGLFGAEPAVLHNPKNAQSGSIFEI